MESTICPVCGSDTAVYHISFCPRMDPYQGDQQAEDDDYEFGARYDRWDGYGDHDTCQDEEDEFIGPIAPEVFNHPVFIPGARFDPINFPDDLPF